MVEQGLNESLITLKLNFNHNSKRLRTYVQGPPPSMTESKLSHGPKMQKTSNILKNKNLMKF